MTGCPSATAALLLVAGGLVACSGNETGTSAIDFSMDIDRESDPAGDRVVVTLNGKFLSFKKY